jgi:ubiquitin C-terminal hydrolase
MNSSLQALYSCDAFANIFLLEPEPIIRSNSNGLIRNIIHLFKLCRDSPPNKPVDPRSFKLALSKVFPQYSNNNQHDSALFIWSLFDKLCDIVGHPPGTVPLDWKDTRFPVKNNEISPSIVRDIFGLKEYSIKTYHPCNHAVELSTVFNCMLILKISNNENPTLAQCLNNYAIQKGLIENSICSACGKDSNMNDKSLKLINAPQMLLMNIARFLIDESGNTSKDESPLNIPLILENLGNLSTEETNKYSYQLTGVVHHSGTLTEGHYTASVRMNDGTWLYCNDHTITKKDTIKFEREMREQNGPFKAVVLVYSRMIKNPRVGGKQGNTTKRRKRCPIRPIKKQIRS